MKLSKTSESRNYRRWSDVARRAKILWADGVIQAYAITSNPRLIAEKQEPLLEAGDLDVLSDLLRDEYRNSKVTFVTGTCTIEKMADVKISVLVISIYPFLE